jgi:hypothetical protein
MRTIGLCGLGALTTSLLLQPLAIIYSAGDLEKVEDPKHLSAVLTTASNQRRQRIGAPPANTDPTSRAGGVGQIPSQPPVGMGGARSRSSGMGGPNDRTNQWGDDVGATDLTYATGDMGSNSTSAEQYSQPSSNQSSYSASGPAQSNTPSEGAPQQKSRWAQLRGERGVQESSWDHIRQQNAREAYNKQSADGKGQPGQPAFSQEPVSAANQVDYERRQMQQQQGGGLADPDFGKVLSPARAQAQREYERSFERERKGIDS